MKGKFAWGIMAIEVIIGIALGAYGIISVNADELNASVAKIPADIVTPQAADQIAQVRARETEKVTASKAQIRDLGSRNMIEAYRGGSEFVSKWNREWREALAKRIENLSRPISQFKSTEGTQKGVEPDPTLPQPLEGITAELSRPGTPFTARNGTVEARLGRMALSGMDTLITAAEKAHAAYVEDFPLQGSGDISAFHDALAISRFGFEGFAEGEGDQKFGEMDPFLRRPFSVTFLINPRMLPYILAETSAAFDEAGMAVDMVGMNMQPHRVPVSLYHSKGWESYKLLYPEDFPPEVETDREAYEAWMSSPDGWSALWRKVYENPEEHEELSVALTLNYHMLEANSESPLLAQPAEESFE